jgi:hypothetical protein
MQATNQLGQENVSAMDTQRGRDHLTKRVDAGDMPWLGKTKLPF